MSGIISDASLLEMERQRSQLAQTLKTKGINVPNDSTMQNSINAVGGLEGTTDYLFTPPIHIINKTIEYISNPSIFKLQDGLTTFFLSNAKSVPSLRFDNGYGISHLYLPKVKVIGNDFVYGTKGIEKLILPSAEVSNGGSLLGSSTIIYAVAPKLEIQNIFYSTTNSSTVILDIKKATTSLGTGTINSIETIILRDPANLTPLGTSRVNSSVEIYVPNDMVNTYKSATNWSAFSSNIFKLEDSPYESETWYETEQWYIDEMNYWKSIYGEHIFDEITLEEEEE